MRYLACKFNPWDRQSYTYTYDGDAHVAPGVEVEVETGRGPALVTVESVHDERPASVPAHVELKAVKRVLSRDESQGAA